MNRRFSAVAFVATVVGVIAYFIALSQHAEPIAVQAAPPDNLYPLPGDARRWEASMGVGTYTSVNLRNGNLLTEIPLVAWSGVGPSIDFRLYHNSG